MTGAASAGTPPRPRVAIVGGGVSGLAAAHRLRRMLGDDAELTLIEQTDRLGGKLATVELAGRDFDVGAEAFLARRPEALRLAEEIGLAEDVVHPGAAGASVRAGGDRHPLPARTLMGIPSAAEPARRVLSSSAADAVAAEPTLPAVRLGTSDTAVGTLIRERFGDEVLQRLVEPLLGGVYGGSADGLGLRATVPALAAALDAGAESVTDAVVRALPAPATADEPKPPVFGAFRNGYRSLIDRLASLGANRVRLGTPVRALERTATGWRLRLGSAVEPEVIDSDAVVLAVPAPSARKLLAEAAPLAAEHFARVELSSMAVAGLALPAQTRLPDASGALIARGETHAGGRPFTAKAFTFSGRKWSHLRGVGGEVLLRASVGRGRADELHMDDEELLRRVREDLAELIGFHPEVVDSVVARWGGGLPQYGVGHLDTVTGIESAVAELPGLEVAGAALHGVGVPACVATGEAAASGVAEHLSRR